MQELCVTLEQEDDASGFLGVTLEQYLKTRFIDMKQTGIIKCVIGVVVLEYCTSKGKFTP